MGFFSRTLQKIAGNLVNGQQEYCSCTVLNPLAYEKMVKPAITDIHGEYPKEINEIMLSQKTMAYLGIKEAKIGMKIPLEFYWNDIFLTDLNGEKDFVLSGYYTDLANDLTEISTAFISEKRLQAGGGELYPCRILIDTDKTYTSGSRIEKMLHKDIGVGGKQQFVSKNSAFYRAFESIMGGYGTAIVFTLLILLSLFLLVYNVLYISMSNNIRQYGLLEVLGVTKKIIKKIMYLQILQIWFWGSVVARIVSSVIVGGIYTKLVSKIYLDNQEFTIQVFHWRLLILVSLVILLVLLLAVMLSIKNWILLSPNEALKYQNVSRDILSVKKISFDCILVGIRM